MSKSLYDFSLMELKNIQVIDPSPSEWYMCWSVKQMSLVNLLLRLCQEIKFWSYIIVFLSSLPSTFFIFSSKIICSRPTSVPHNSTVIFVASVELSLCDPKFRAAPSKAWSTYFQNNLPLSIFSQYPRNWTWQGRKRVE